MFFRYLYDEHYIGSAIDILRSSNKSRKPIEKHIQHRCCISKTDVRRTRRYQISECMTKVGT